MGSHIAMETYEFSLRAIHVVMTSWALIKATSSFLMIDPLMRPPKLSTMTPALLVSRLRIKRLGPLHQPIVVSTCFKL